MKMQNTVTFQSDPTSTSSSLRCSTRRWRPGKHVASIFVQYAPYQIKEGPEYWPQRREAFGDAVVDTLAEYCPGLKESILHRQVLTPWDIEQEFGLTEGNIFHGELSLLSSFSIDLHLDGQNIKHRSKGFGFAEAAHIRAVV